VACEAWLPLLRCARALEWCGLVSSSLFWDTANRDKGGISGILDVEEP